MAGIVIPVLRRRKLRYKEVKWPAKASHPVSVSARGSTPGPLTPEPHVEPSVSDGIHDLGDALLFSLVELI